jgi:hypothetical protein
LIYNIARLKSFADSAEFAEHELHAAEAAIVRAEAR